MTDRWSLECTPFRLRVRISAADRHESRGPVHISTDEVDTPATLDRCAAAAGRAVFIALEYSTSVARFLSRQSALETSSRPPRQRSAVIVQSCRDVTAGVLLAAPHWRLSNWLASWFLSVTSVRLSAT